MSTNGNMPISQHFWDWMQSYWHDNRSFPPAHPDWRKKADLVGGKVPAGQLPSYVDDVLEFNSYTELPKPGEKGKIYVITQNNTQFRWSGSEYIQINADENLMTIHTNQTITGIKTFTQNILMSRGGTIDIFGNLIPKAVQSGGHATGVFWKTPDNRQNISSVGALTMNGELNYLYMGWGNEPYSLGSCLAVGSNILEYKGNKIFHQGNFTPTDYVTQNTDQNIDGKKTFTTSFNSYTSDGLFSSYARPLSTITPGGKNLLFGYKDFGSGQYYPRIGFVSETNWSLGAIGNNFTIGTNNDGSAIFSLSPSGKLLINNSEVYSVNNFNPELKAERENNAVGIGFDIGNIENPYIKHNSGRSLLATKSWATNTFIPKTHPVANINQSQINSWNNSISRSSASEEVILEDDILTIQPDEFSLAGNSSYSIGSKKKLVHVLFKEGTELNIRELTKRQTVVIFNFSRSQINLIIEDLSPYPLSSEMQVTLYINDEGEVLLYNETSFKIMQ